MNKLKKLDFYLIIFEVVMMVLLAICIALISDKLTLFIVSAIIMIAIFLVLLYLKNESDTSTLEKIRYINRNADDSLRSVLGTMPVGVIKFNPQTNREEWLNPYAELAFTNEDGDFDYTKLRELLSLSKEDMSNYFTIGEKKFSIHLQSDSETLYFFDVSSEYHTNSELLNMRPVLGVMSIDNYDDVTSALLDTDISNINTFVTNFISQFASQYNLYYRRVDVDRIYFFTRYDVLERLVDNKFELLEQFRSQANEKEIPLTMSLGVAFGGDNYRSLGQIAQQNLNIALVRGGDQAVVQENGDDKALQYFGGGTASTVKRTRTRTRAMMTAISDRIRKADHVFVVGHRHLDMDAFGAAVGMEYFANNIAGNAYVVYDETDQARDISLAIQKVKEDGVSSLLTIKEAVKKVTKKSLLIMVDHSKPSLTLSEELFQKSRQTIVVDHHRRNDDFPDNVVLSYIESGASSACELVTELIQFQNNKENQLSKVQASVLMAGIMLDTKNFSSRVTSRTFDVASYLRSTGSDSGEIQQISATDFDDYRLVNELVLKGQRLSDNIMIASGDENNYYNTVVISKAANTLLSMAGINASFVLAKTESDVVAISARSRENVNVQKIMEQLGGGGHFGLAGAQIKGKSLADVEQSLRQIIKEDLLEGVREETK